MPAELKDLRQNAVLQLKELKADCKQLLTVIEDPSLAKIKTEKPSEGKESTKTSQEKAFKDALLQLIEKQGIEVDEVLQSQELHTKSIPFKTLLLIGLVAGYWH